MNLLDVYHSNEPLTVHGVTGVAVFYVYGTALF